MKRGYDADDGADVFDRRANDMRLIDLMMPLREISRNMRGF